MKISDVVDKHLTNLTEQIEKIGGHAPEIWQAMVGRQVLFSSASVFLGFLVFFGIIILGTFFYKKCHGDPEYVIGLIVTILLGGAITIGLIGQFPNIFYPEAKLIADLLK